MLRWMSLIFCALLIFSGQLALGRFMPALNHSYDIKLSTAIALIIIAIVTIRKNLFLDNNKSKALPLLVLGCSIGLIILGMSIDASQDRAFQAQYNFDLLKIGLICLLIWVCIDSKKDFLFFLNIICIASIVILLIDYEIWKIFKLIFISELSKSRIIIFGLGSAVFLFFIEQKIKNFILIILATFFLLSCSLKIGFIAFILFVMFVFSACLINKRYRISLQFLIAILIGVIAAYSLGGTDALVSRANNLELGISQSSATYKQSLKLNDKNFKDDGIKNLCSESSNYQFCISNEYVIKDSTERLRLWSHAAQLILSHPYFGVGDEGYRISLAYGNEPDIKISNYSYPHNLFLNIAVQFGILYTAIVILIVYLSFIKSASIAKIYIEVNCLIGMGLAILASSMVGGDIFDARYIFLMIVLSAIYDQVSKKSLKPYIRHQ